MSDEADGTERYTIVLGPEEVAIIERIRAHCGSSQTKRGAIHYALHEWARFNPDEERQRRRMAARP